MKVAWVLQRGLILKGPYEVGGWDYIDAGRCERLATGDVAGNSMWMHVVSEGVVLTRDGIDGLFESDLQFCISDDNFEYSRAETGTTQSCGQNRYLAPFPISTWQSSDVGDLTVKLNPDDQIRRNPNADSRRRAQLPDLHGALAEFSGHWFGSMFHDTTDEAQRAALKHCRSESKGAPCRVEVAFKNQCVAVARGRGQAAVTLGQAGWTQQRTLDAALKKCAQGGDATCGESIAFCSTQEAKVAQQNSRANEAQQTVLGILGGALGAIWGVPPPTPAKPAPEADGDIPRKPASGGEEDNLQAYGARIKNPKADWGDQKFSFIARDNVYYDLTNKWKVPNLKDSLPWPGAVPFVNESVSDVAPGTILDVYGRIYSSQLYVPGASISQRGLAPGSELLDYRKVRVLKSFRATVGTAAPFGPFDAVGGAKMYSIWPRTIKNWIELGYLEQIEGPVEDTY